MTNEQRRELLEIKERLARARVEEQKSFDNAPDGMNYCEFEVYMSPIQEEISRLDLERRMLEEPELKPIRKGCHLMTLETFIECVNDGGFMDYDGSGNYATKDMESNISILPSDVESGKIRREFTHVVWYNR